MRELLVILAGIILLAGCGNSSEPQAEKTGSSNSSVCPAGQHAVWGEGCVGPSPTPSFQCTRDEVITDTGCKPYVPSTFSPTPELDDTGCAESFSFSCDFATNQTCIAAEYYAKQGGYSLVEAFIEQKADVVPTDINQLCPEYLKAWNLAKRGFNDGYWEVGKEIRAGKYKTTARVADCYWERTGTNGRILDNAFITIAKKVTVTIRKTDNFFTSRECGYWIPA